MLPSTFSRSAIRLLFALTVCASLASAALIFERDAPTTNLNNSVPRSNVGLNQGTIGGTAVILGDDFTVTGSHVINSFTVWVVGDVQPVSGDFTLYFGPDITVDTIGLANSTSTFTAVADGTYTSVSNSELTSTIWKLVFDGLSYAVTDGTYDFAVDLKTTTAYSLYGGDYTTAGGNQQGANGSVSLFDANAPHTQLYSSNPSTFAGWSTFADISVLVDADVNAVPEPSTLALLGFGLLGLGWKFRRRK